MVVTKQQKHEEFLKHWYKSRATKHKTSIDQLNDVYYLVRKYKRIVGYFRNYREKRPFCYNVICEIAV